MMVVVEGDNDDDDDYDNYDDLGKKFYTVYLSNLFVLYNIKNRH